MKREKAIVFLFFLLIFGSFVEEHFWAIVAVVVISLVVVFALYIYPKYAHTELQRKSLETDIEVKKDTLELEKLKLQVEMLKVQSKINKRNAEIEQTELTNDLLRKKLEHREKGSNISGYNDQLNNLQ